MQKWIDNRIPWCLLPGSGAEYHHRKHVMKLFFRDYRRQIRTGYLCERSENFFPIPYYLCSETGLITEPLIRKNMKKLKQLLLILLFLLPSLLQATGKEVPFTLDDRDRIIRTEQKVESLEQKKNFLTLAVITTLHSEDGPTDHRPGC